MGKVMELEKAMADNIECQRQQMVDSMESQRQQMDLMKQELLSRKVEVRTPVIPQIVIPGDTPSKKRKLVETAEGQTQQQVSYAGVTLARVTPLGTHKTSLDRQQQSGGEFP